MNPRIRILQVPKAFLKGGWADKGQGNFMSLGWETILEGEWTTSWPMAWRCEKETGKPLHYYFPWKDLKFYIKEEEHKWTPQCWNTSTTFSSTSPDLLRSRIPINLIQCVYECILSIDKGFCEAETSFLSYPLQMCL